MSASRRSTARLGELVALADKLVRGDALTFGERHDIASIIYLIASDVDVRDDYFTTVKHRPGGDNATAKQCAALDVALDVAAGEAVGAAQDKARGRWGLSYDQMGHAWRQYGKHQVEFIAGEDHAALRKVQAMMLGVFVKRKK